MGVASLGDNFNARLINEAAARTAEDGGGASTMVGLAQTLIEELQSRLVAGADPEALRSGLDQAVDAITGELGAVAEGVTTREQVAAVAATALRRPPGDPTKPPYRPRPKPPPKPRPRLDEDVADRLGRLVVEAIENVGGDGVITVAANDSPEPELELERWAGQDRAVIKVAASSYQELNEHQLGIEAAVRAVRSAAEEGIVTDDGAAGVAEVAFERLDLTGDEAAGAAAVRAAISAMVALSSGRVGRPARGVVPAKGVSSELRNAASVAGQLLGAEALGIDISDWHSAGHFEGWEGFGLRRPENAGQED